MAVRSILEILNQQTNIILNDILKKFLGYHSLVMKAFSPRLIDIQFASSAPTTYPPLIKSGLNIQLLHRIILGKAFYLRNLELQDLQLCVLVRTEM